LNIFKLKFVDHMSSILPPIEKNKVSAYDDLCVGDSTR
jgi:hypothetical protein